MTAPALAYRFGEEKVLEDGRLILWQPFPGMQTEAIAASEFEVFIGGAKGPGKSDVLVVGALRQVDKERYRAYILRETGPQLSELKDRTHRIYSRLPNKPAWNGDGHGRWTFPSGAKIIFEAIGTPEEAERIQGKEPSAIFRDEAANVRDERTIDTEQAEIRSPDPSIIPMWRGSGNPGRTGQAWVKRRFIDKCGVDGSRIFVRVFTSPKGQRVKIARRFIPGTVLDNPIYANDPRYMAVLLSMPEMLRRQLLYGDWNAGFGVALDELDPDIHIVPRFIPPDNWPRFGCLDWGYAHNWVYGYYCVSEDDRVYKIDTVRGRRHQPNEIVERIRSRCDLDHPSYEYTIADSAPFQSRRAMGEGTPTIAEQMGEFGLDLTSASNIDRKAGLNNLRYRLAYRGIGLADSTGKRGDGTPHLLFMDTPGNRWCVAQLMEMVTDEDDMEDVLKVNANPETGQGGDDAYDETRVALASRPSVAEGTWAQEAVHSFSPTTLSYMTEHLYRDRPLPGGNSGRSLAASFIRR